MKLKMSYVFVGFALLLSFIIWGGPRFCRAEESTMKAQGSNPHEVGNKICPISGEKVIPGKEHKVEYNGKVYSLCCSMCEKDFKKDPEAAIKKLETMKKDSGMEDDMKDMDGDDDDATTEVSGMNQEMNK